jgi:subtilisin family serine protease
MIKVFLILSLLFLYSHYLLADTNPNNWGLQAIQSQQAIELASLQKTVRVAVIDTGIDARHPFLKNVIWTNPGESGPDAFGDDRSRNQIDDDRNGFVDDVHGWSFVDQEGPRPVDRHGHGTHIAAIIKSVNPNVQIIPIKYCDPTASAKDNLKNTVKSIRYAIQMKVDIINYSGGGLGANAEEFLALKEASEKGILLVAAAGNEGVNADTAHYYPASYPLENILSVTAFDPWLKILPSSNFGAKSVDIAAPGYNILSAMPANQFGTMTGTSQATAFATGTASLVLSNSNELMTPQQIIQQILQSSEKESHLEGKTKRGSRLNSLRALTMKNQGLSTTGIRSQNILSSTSGPYLH